MFIIWSNDILQMCYTSVISTVVMRVQLNTNIPLNDTIALWAIEILGLILITNQEILRCSDEQNMCKSRNIFFAKKQYVNKPNICSACNQWKEWKQT